MRVLSVETTTTYRYCLKSISNPDIDTTIKKWGLTFTFARTTRSEPIYRTPNNKVEVWDVRFGDPDKNVGASGGYRVVLFYVREEECMFLDYIVERADLNKPKIMQAYQANLKDLKVYLQKSYDSGKN